eukprot:Pgem_evm1s1429
MSTPLEIQSDEEYYLSQKNSLALIDSSSSVNHMAVVHVADNVNLLQSPIALTLEEHDHKQNSQQQKTEKNLYDHDYANDGDHNYDYFTPEDCKVQVTEVKREGNCRTNNNSIGTSTCCGNTFMGLDTLCNNTSTRYNNTSTCRGGSNT